MKSKTYYDIKKNIEGGTYKMVRLVQKIEGEEVPRVIIPYNNVAGDSVKLACERLDFIRMKCDKALPAGNYIVQCRISQNNKSIIDQYEFTLTGVTVLTNTVQDKTLEQETDMNIDYNDHIKLIHENAQLKAQITQLEFENKWIKEHGITKVATLADGSPVPVKKEGWEILGEVLSETLPSLVNMGDRHFDLQEKRLNLEGKKLDSGLIRKTSNKKTMKVVKKKEPTFEEIAQEEADYMDSLSEEDFDKEMDILENEDPDIYNRVCEILDIEIEEDDDQQNEEE